MGTGASANGRKWERAGSANGRKWERAEVGTGGSGNGRKWERAEAGTRGSGNGLKWERAVVGTRGSENARKWERARASLPIERRELVGYSSRYSNHANVHLSHTKFAHDADAHLS